MNTNTGEMVELNEAMQKLSEPHRMVVTLHDVQGLAHEEIAEIMHIPLGTVKARIFRAREMLKRCIQE